MPGRKQKPIQMKKLQGTAKPCRDSGKEELTGPPLPSLPPAPQNLKAEGLEYYKTQGLVCLKIGTLNELTLPMFLTICLGMSRLFMYYRKIEEMPEYDLDNIFRIQRAINEAERNLRSNMAEFGLTPASVGKVVIKREKKSKLQSFIES